MKLTQEQKELVHAIAAANGHSEPEIYVELVGNHYSGEVPEAPKDQEV